jgi:hypothetical protein
LKLLHLKFSFLKFAPKCRTPQSRSRVTSDRQTFTHVQNSRFLHRAIQAKKSAGFERSSAGRNRPKADLKRRRGPLDELRD